MVNIQVTVINESIVSKDDQVQSALPELLTQEHQDFAPNWDSKHSERILCCYVNSTSFLQIARSANVSNWYFERVIFPGERLLFEALPDAQLEIHTGMRGTAILSDNILCDRLRISP